jgi:uncharacterized protein involved in exopolysaccharide biosynthesis
MAVLFKRKWSILVVMVVALFSSLFYLLIIRDDAYTAVAKILIRVGPEQAPATTVIGQLPSVISYRNQDVNSEIDILTSTNLVGQLVDELHLDVVQPKPVPDGLFRKIKYYSKRFVNDVKELINNERSRLGDRAGTQRTVRGSRSGIEHGDGRSDDECPGES